MLYEVEIAVCIVSQLEKYLVLMLLVIASTLRYRYT